jgi:hypothetical protein
MKHDFQDVYSNHFSRSQVVTMETLLTANRFLMRFVDFPATEYDKVLSGYQPGQMLER